MRADAWDDWADSASSSRRDADGFGRDAESANDDANDTKHAKDSRLGGLLLALTHTSSDAPDDARRLAAELHGRVSDIGAAAARVAATESALDASRLGDARATALAALSGLASRGVDALGADDAPSDGGVSAHIIPSVRDTHRRVFVRMATFAIRTAARATTDGSHKEENTKTEIAKTRAGGAETLARTIAAELAETRAAPAGGLGAGLGDGARTSATLDGVVAAITGNPRAPAWARDGRAREDFDFEPTERNRGVETETRVALADALTCAARVVVGIRDRALAEAFARATYPTLAAHASSRVTNDERETTRDERRTTNDERKTPEASARAACFSTCAVAFALAATDVSSRESAGRDEGLGATKDSDEARAHGERCRHVHKRAALAHARDLAAAAARALRDGAAAPATRVAAAGLATAMLAADDDALEVIARSGALDELRAALEVAARAEDVPPLADAARGLLGAMGA